MPWRRIGLRSRVTWSWSTVSFIRCPGRCCGAAATGRRGAEQSCEDAQRQFVGAVDGSGEQVDDDEVDGTQERGQGQQSAVVGAGGEADQVGDHQADETDAAGDGDDGAGQQRADDQQDGAQPIDVHAERGGGLVAGQQGVAVAVATWCHPNRPRRGTAPLSTWARATSATSHRRRFGRRRGPDRPRHQPGRRRHRPCLPTESPRRQRFTTPWRSESYWHWWLFSIAAWCGEPVSASASASSRAAGVRSSPGPLLPGTGGYRVVTDGRPWRRSWCWSRPTRMEMRSQGSQSPIHPIYQTFRILCLSCLILRFERVISFDLGVSVVPLDSPCAEAP